MLWICVVQRQVPLASPHGNPFSLGPSVFSHVPSFLIPRFSFFVFRFSFLVPGCARALSPFFLCVMILMCPHCSIHMVVVDVMLHDFTSESAIKNKKKKSQSQGALTFSKNKE